MKNLVFVLALICFGVQAQTSVDDSSSISRNVRVFPFEVAGIKFNAKTNSVALPQQFHPQGVELERITKIHSSLISSLSPSSNGIASTLRMLDYTVGSVDYQITDSHDYKIFISDYYENGQKVEGKIALRIMIPGEYDYRGVRLSDSRFNSLYYSFINDIQNKLKDTDKYRAIVLLQESSLMLGDVGRAPAFVGEIEVVDAPRIQEQQEDGGLVQRHPHSSQRQLNCIEA